MTEIDMPGGSGTASGGFDGVAVASDGTAFVPAGTSVWELSVEKSTKAKADADYAKRTQGPNGETCADVTYVQVILRPWTKAREWRNARSQEGRWKQVRAYNLDSVHTWLESAPATSAWLASRLGKQIPGVTSAADWWDELWLPSTHIPLSAEVVLAGREAAASELVDSLIPGRAVTVGGGLRIDDLRAFVSAALQSSTDGRAESLRAQTLFVDSIESLAQLMRQNQPLVLVVPHPSWLSNVAVRSPHVVIMAALPGQIGAPEVPAVDSEAVTRQLTAAGAPDQRAYSWGLLARRSLLALRRALALNPVQLTPDWAQAPGMTQRRLLLLGGWEGTNVDDRTVVAQTVGLTYGNVQEIATDLAVASDVPFLGRFREQWHVLTPEDAWALLRTHITLDDLRALRTASLDVFGSEHGAKFSSTLRIGLAQTLALLGALGDDVRLTGGNTGREFSRSIVNELLSKANEDNSYRHWASLSDVLPLLAEAAPDEFIDALRQGLVDDEPLHRLMFQDAPGGVGFTPPSPHNHFLWALQTIAWAEDHFPDVIDLLARLAAIDPGGQWSTRPDTALADMMSSWHPCTAVSEQTHRNGLRQLMRAHPTVTRRLLLALIPTGHEIQTPAAKPQFRDWVRPIHMTYADIRRAIEFVTDMLFDDLDDDIDRHLELLTKLEALLPQHRQSFVDKLAALGVVVTDDGDRARVADAVRAKVAHHREYADTQWALPEAELLLLEQAEQTWTPTSAVRRERWLFDNDMVELGDVARRDDFAAYDAAVSARRVAAAAAVVQAGGMQALVDLVDGVSRPYLVGYALAGHTSDFDQAMIAWLQEGAHRREAARGYLRARLRGDDSAVCERLLALTQDPAVKAEVLRAVDDPRKAWEKLPALEDEVTRSYWCEFVYFGLGPDFSGVEHVARNLAAVGRDAAALNLIVLYSKRVASLQAAEIAAQACEALLAREEPDPEIVRLREHGFSRILGLLALHKDTLGLSRVAFLEWQLVPALGFEAQVPTLHAALQEDPNFFADLVSQVYRANNEEPPDDEDGSPEVEHRRRLAERAYRVLKSWTQSPGIGANDLIEADLLHSWITRAREALQETGRPVTGDLMIGQALAYAPPDAEGLFPPRPVRDLLEDLRADHIERGLETGIVNHRGVTWRGMTDGGSQEWQLAANYRKGALAATGWPRTQKILRRLAERYEQEARREDDEAERHRRGLPD
ncbi:hypothetical protein [Lentzea sp. NPDC003310]|uniref:hypothetical protein n=1 Tax=Lentzea sp. NPDC003310 TaxID=3154447 RepID=UPI0033AFC31F